MPDYDEELVFQPSRPDDKDEKRSQSRRSDRNIETTDVTDFYAQNLRAMEREAMTCPRAQGELDKVMMDLNHTSGSHERRGHDRRASVPAITSVSEAQDLFRSDPVFRMTPVTSQRERRKSMSEPHRPGIHPREPRMHESLSRMLGGGSRGNSLFSSGRPRRPVYTGVEGGVIEYDDDDWDEEAFDDEFGGNMMYDLSRAPSRDRTVRRDSE